MTDTQEYNRNHHEHYDHQRHLEDAYEWLTEQERKVPVQTSTEMPNPTK